MALLCVIGCEESMGHNTKEKRITVKGSDTMVILVQRWAETYAYTKRNVMVQVTGGGSGTGIAALINGGTEICASSRPMTKKEKDQVQNRRGQGVAEIPVAFDGVAIFVHNDNPVDNLSLAQLNAIYQGKITDWNDIGGSAGGIACYGPENNTGTYHYFKERILSGNNFDKNVQALPGAAIIINLVSKDKHAIGFSGIGYTKGVKVIRIRLGKNSDFGILPTSETVVSDIYPLSRKLYFYTVGTPKDEVREFINWVNGEQGRLVCEDVGYYPFRQE